MQRYILLFVCFWLLGQSAFGQRRGFADNEELFEYLKFTILDRDAHAPVKYERLEMNLEAELDALKQQLLDAETLDEVYLAVVRISALRRDSHITLRPFFRRDSRKRQLPIRFSVDFSDPELPVLMLDQGFGILGRRSPTYGAG